MWYRLPIALVAFILGSASASAVTRTITIGPGLAFSPASTTANPGDTIVWQGLSNFHSVIQTTGSGTCSVDGAGFNSGSPPVAGGTFSWTVPANFTGTVFFKCGPHCGSGMRGSIVVVAAPAPCAGDADGNRTVNFSDVTVVLSNFGGTPPPGDANSDGSVSFGDVTTVLANFGTTCP
jgi:plastocyanin